MRRYRHLFFDLDHTLWDFTTNSRATLAELFVHHGLAAQGVTDAASFIEVYEEVNHGLWQRYERGHLDKEVLRVLRFRNTLMHFGVRDGGLADALGRDYLHHSPMKAALMPGTLQLLTDLRPHYALHIITNGFEEVQHVKLSTSGIGSFFRTVITSEKAGAKKPDPRIFAFALRHTDAAPEECLMIGDNHGTDMAGARLAGWDHAHYTAATAPDPEATFRVGHLDDLRAILL
ncbi:MAG: YjjG family noncanonical pyrimidine nucleotidase [Flavobacteriales bacterium]